MGSDDDEDIWNDIPPSAVLTNFDKEQITTKGVRANSITSLQTNTQKPKSPKIKSKQKIDEKSSDFDGDCRRDSAPNTQKRQLPSDYIFRSEDSMESEKIQIINSKVKDRKPQN